MSSEVRAQMRDEWNERAREDAHYFVAFGRREQDDEEFFATGDGLVGELVKELKRTPGRVRALEIGCGPGRLLRPLSRHFDEIHGIDVSDEMIALAKRKLAGVPNAFPQHASGSDLAIFPDAHFDFVYSYAVFQHIPSADVVFSYLREAMRVLKPGGVARLHINGLPKTSKTYTTWEGVRIGAGEVRAFAAEQSMELLALTGVDTQYMWTTWRKPFLADPLADAYGSVEQACSIRAITNAFSGEQAVPASGRLACAALSMEGLPEGADVNTLRVEIGGLQGTVCFVGPRAHNGLTQINVFLPTGLRTGILPVRVAVLGRECSGYVRVIPPGPAVPRLTAISDGVNLLSPQHIESGFMKATIEEVDDIRTFAATVDDQPVEGIDTFRTDPLCERWEVNFEIPKSLAKGGHVLDVKLGRRLLTRMGIVLSLAMASFAADSPEVALRKALAIKTGTVTLPAGTIELTREVVVAPDVHDLLIQGKGTTLKAADNFRGRGLLVLSGGLNIRVEGLALNGNRETVGRMAVLPPLPAILSRVTDNNGIVAEGVTGLEIRQIKASHIAGFGVLVNGGLGARLTDVEITESGGFNTQHLNSGMGGIAIEENAADFEVRRCLIGGIRGTGITLRQVKRGTIRENELNIISGDIISADRVNAVTIRNNRSRQVGFPANETDGRSICIRLTRSTDSVVEGNTCAEAVMGAMRVQGDRNRIAGNHFLKLNIAHQEIGGIVIVAGSTGNTVEGNEIAGPRMGTHCVDLEQGITPGANRVGRNECEDEASLALSRPLRLR